MEYYIDKSTYLSIKEKLYDKEVELYVEKYIPNFEMKLPLRDIFSKPSKVDFKNKYTLNIPEYLHEINSMRRIIYSSLIQCCSHDRYSRDLYEIRESNNYRPKETEFYGTIKFIERERYMKVVLYDLFSYREKISLLIHSITNQKLFNGKIENVTFKRIEDKIDKLNVENCNHLSIENVELLKNIIVKLNSDEDVKFVCELRHAYMHRSNPGIDCLATRIHTFDRISSESAERLSILNNRPASEYENYVNIGKKNIEVEKTFEEVIFSILKVWRNYQFAIKEIVDNIEIVGINVEQSSYVEGTFDFG